MFKYGYFHLKALAIKVMNEYCKYKIKSFYEKYIDRTFDQDDVAQFFVNSRDYSKRGSIIREVGDFLAHPNLKDRGIVLDSIKEIMPLFDNMLEDKRRGKVDYFNQPTFKGLGSDDELINDLNHIFESAGINAKLISREDNNYRDFLFCTIFLLSTFKIKYNEQELTLQAVYSHSLKLQVICESKNYQRHFAALPVLQLSNVWTNCPTTFSAPEYTLENHIARRFKQGFIAAISYENDSIHKKTRFDSNDFEKGQIWPSPDSAIYG